MATIIIPDTSGQPGLVAQGADDISAVDIALVTGNEPAILQTDELVALSQTIAQYSVVGFNANGELIPAVAGTTQAIGIAMVAITSPGSGPLKSIPVYRAGCFNPAKLSWPASYNTALLKRNAFKGAPTPTNIVIREVRAATVV